MALNPLFNLDPSRYELGRGSGMLRKVVTARPDRNAELGSLISGLQTPVAPDTSTLPTVNQLDDVWKQNRSNLLKMRDFAIKNLVQVGRGTFGYGGAEAILNGDKSYLNQSTSQGVKMQIQEYQNQWLKQYANPWKESEAALKEYQKQAEAYNKEFKKIEPAITQYNKEVKGYNKEKGNIIQDYQNSLIDPARVEQKQQQAAGQSLQDSALYSDDLHNMMLQKIGEVNQEALLPTQDSVSNLYGGTK